MSAVQLKHEWRACLAIMRNAANSGANRGAKPYSWLLAALAALPPALALALDGNMRLCLLISGVALAVLLAQWCLLLLTSLVEQNGPHARLVPRMAARSVTVLGVAALAVLLLLALALVVFSIRDATALAPFTNILILLTAGALAPKTSLPLAAVLLGPAFIDNYVELPALTVAAARVVGVAWLASAIVRNLYRGYPAGASMFWQVELAASRQRTELAPAAYGRSLARACVQRLAGPLLLHCAGPKARAMPLTEPAIAAALVISLACKLWSAHYTMIILVVVPAVLLLGQLFHAATMLAAVRATRREQEIVMLSARRPDAQLVNRLLVRGMLRQFARSWILSSVALLAICAAAGVPIHLLPLQLAACLITLAAGATLLKNYVATDAGGMPMLTLMGTAAAATLVAGLDGPAGMTNVALVAVALAAAGQLGRRWRGGVPAAGAGFARGGQAGLN